MYKIANISTDQHILFDVLHRGALIILYFIINGTRLLNTVRNIISLIGTR